MPDPSGCAVQPFQLTKPTGLGRAPSAPDPSTTRSLSHPLAAEIHRRASRPTSGAAMPGSQPSTSRGELTMPQRYSPASSFQVNAAQAPVRRPLTSTPIGHGSAAQHTPQPLHGAASGGFGGAAGWRRMTWRDMVHATVPPCLRGGSAEKAHHLVADVQRQRLRVSATFMVCRVVIVLLCPLAGLRPAARRLQSANRLSRAAEG